MSTWLWIMVIFKWFSKNLKYIFWQFWLFFWKPKNSKFKNLLQMNLFKNLQVTSNRVISRSNPLQPWTDWKSHFIHGASEKFNHKTPRIRFCRNKIWHSRVNRGTITTKMSQHILICVCPASLMIPFHNRKGEIKQLWALSDGTVIN